MVSILPNEINLSIVSYMDFDCLLKSYLYIDGFNNLINTHTLDNLIDEKLAVYRISINKKQVLKKNKEKLYRFLKYTNNVSLNIFPYIAYDIANMNDNQYNRFDFLYNNGINYLFAEMASNDSYNLNQNKIDKLIEIYKFIKNNRNDDNNSDYSELFICYYTIIKMVQTFNEEEIKVFYYLFQNKFKIKIAFEIIINNFNINDTINIYKDGCPDYLIISVLTHFDIKKRQDLLKKITSGINPLDAYRQVLTEGYIKNFSLESVCKS
jgi:hypothetical protein